MKVKSLSHVPLFPTPGTAAYQAPPSMGFSRQEYWRGVPLPSPCVSGALAIFYLQLCIIFLDGALETVKTSRPTKLGSAAPGGKRYQYLLLSNCYLQFHVLILFYSIISSVAQSCLTLRDPRDCSLPRSSVHRISQARVLEWVAISFPNA